MRYRSAVRKRRLEQLLMWPFVALGKLCGYIFPLRTKHGAILFFPNGDIGGSPRVNIDIIHCIKDLNPLVVFSKKPKNNQFLERFKVEGTRIMDLHPYIDHKAFHFVNFFFRGVLATWINRQKKTVVLGGECIYFYKVIPHLRRDIKCIEVCHLDTWLPYSIGFIDLIHTRVFSTEKLKQQVEKQYNEDGLDVSYFHKLRFIDNAIDIPSYREQENELLEVYFIGRGSPQKRVHLIAAIAEKLHNNLLPIRVNFVGDVEKVIDPSRYPFCRFYGNVSDENLMNRIYQEADVLLMTSAFEGLPVVVMQMMASAKVVVSTAVNGIPDYIFHRGNGLLIYAQEEGAIVEEGVALLEELLRNKQLRKELGVKAREDAMAKFGREVFCRNYRALLC